jgi:hypothetical protein
VDDRIGRRLIYNALAAGAPQHLHGGRRTRRIAQTAKLQIGGRQA